MYEWMGRAHAALARERGQGTVEYVGLILLLGVVLAGVVTAAGQFDEGNAIVGTVVKKLKDAIVSVGGE
jgi:hypothetical protein